MTKKVSNLSMAVLQSFNAQTRKKSEISNGILGRDS